MLIFEDDGSVRQVLSAYCSWRGYDVASFATPAPACPLLAEGADRCEAPAACCEVLLTDRHMPGADGADLLERQALKGCKVDARNKALLTGAPDAELRERLARLGCALFAKPFVPATLAAWLASCEERLGRTGQQMAAAGCPSRRSAAS
jgi:CheY-like chemotaxis protein